MGLIEELAEAVKQQQASLDYIREAQELLLSISTSQGLTHQALSSFLGLHYNTVGDYLKCYTENKIEVIRLPNGKPKTPLKVSLNEAIRIRQRLKSGEKFITPKSKRRA